MLYTSPGKQLLEKKRNVINNLPDPTQTYRQLLQAMLYMTCSMVSLMYYMRNFRFNTFTVFSLALLTGTCYVWTEVQGKRGSCEIATCLNLHLQSLPPTKTHMILYSDACGGQNRNQMIATCFLEAVESIPSLITNF